MEHKDDRRDLVGFILPKTVVGLALWLLIFALGASVSGVVFFVAYERRLTDIQTQITSLRTQFTQQLNDAVTQLQNADKAMQGGVTGTALGGITGQSAKLLTEVGPSMVVVEGTDVTGARTSGSGFVLQSSANQSWVLTSYQLVAGSIAASQATSPVGFPAPAPALGVTGTVSGTAAPAPPPPPTASVNIAGNNHTGTIYSWDASRNLALIIVNVGSVPALPFSNDVATPGLSVWAMSASGGQFGATASQGQVVSANPQTLATSAVFGPQATGGPLVDQEGRVIGVLVVARPPPTPTPAPTPRPSPSGQSSPGTVVPVRQACIEVVICPR
jgi:S1-C subfamily serine protease